MIFNGLLHKHRCELLNDFCAHWTTPGYLHKFSAHSNQQKLEDEIHGLKSATLQENWIIFECSPHAKWLRLRWHPWAYWKADLAKRYENKCSMWFDKGVRTKLKSSNWIVMRHNVWVPNATLTRFVSLEVFWLPWVFKSQNDGLIKSWGVAKHMKTYQEDFKLICRTLKGPHQALSVQESTDLGPPAGAHTKIYWCCPRCCPWLA